MACGTAQASDWRSLGTSANGSGEDFVDVSSIRAMGSVRWAWVKAVFAPRAVMRADDGPNVNSWLVKAVQRKAFDCNAETVRMEALTFYYSDATDEQADSCKDQERAGRDKAKELGVTVVGVYTDEGISGTDSTRPAYTKMMADANAKVFDTLILWKLNRLGRHAPIREVTMRRLENRHGIRIVTADHYDSSKDSAKNRKLTRGFKGLMDEAYIDELSEDVHRGQEGKFLKGYWVGGRVYGYKLETSAHERDPYGNQKQVATLIKVDPVQAKIVEEIFERFAKGASPQAIAVDLNKRNFPSRGSTWKRKTRRCSGWARSAIRAMIENPIYTGTLYWNRSKWLKLEDSGKRLRKERPTDDLRGSAGNAPHLRIIHEATWRLAQLRMNVNKVKPGDKRLKSGGKCIYMLSGLLVCECGAHFVLDSKRRIIVAVRRWTARAAASPTHFAFVVMLPNR